MSTQESDTPQLSKEWSLIAQDYELMEELGSGSFGSVIKARHIKSNTNVAIKLLKNQFQDTYQAKKLISEIQVMRKLTAVKGNCFTTHIFDVVTSEFDPKSPDYIDYVFIVMDYEATDLK